jgi:glutaminyl-peptide cyclotransferase
MSANIYATRMQFAQFKMMSMLWRSLAVAVSLSVFTISTLATAPASRPPALDGNNTLTAENIRAHPHEGARAARKTDGYQVIHTYPHDSKAFTQGLIFRDGHLYESTGLNGRSSIRMVDLLSGELLQRHELASQYFGEGLTDWDSTLIQLTWKSHKAFVYDRFSFSLQRTFDYEGEGWGLTHDEEGLIMSDGTAYLRFLDPESFRVTRRLRVIDESGHPVDNLNELEYIHGEIYANIWQTDKIIRVSPRTGRILGWIDLTGIIDKGELRDSGAVLNGIAYDPAGDRLFVTGKLWPKLFEIKVVNR